MEKWWPNYAFLQVPGRKNAKKVKVKSEEEKKVKQVSVMQVKMKSERKQIKVKKLVEGFENWSQKANAKSHPQK